MSMKKIIMVSTWITFFCLCYIGVKKGVDLLVGVAILTNVISNALNVACIMKEEKNAKRES
nr:MAG TPA: hypothetical protein [Caudoviricetes sp.]